ncbi:rod shape-determining protein MreD [Bacillus ectoiniformans]|uniref:rod shape-determining protein MreD n=1 Tax=Bacillus ectoiniformans TaxID=1494429 RepID=UPI00195EA688|nr:rod shape-determining protein MreD [Bacillus ectoiniformans]
MKRYLLPLLMIACFYSDSLFLTWFPDNAFDGKYVPVPRLFAMALMLMAIFFNRNAAIKYGFLFGFLFDLFYTGILGVYMFFLPLIVYVTSKLVKVLQNNLFIVALIILFDLFLLEFIMYEVNILLQRTQYTLSEFIHIRLWPTLILNLIFYLILSIPLKNSFEKLRRIFNE